MRTLTALASIAFYALAACSRADQAKTGADMKDAGRQVDNAAASVAHSPSVRNVEADFKKAGRTAKGDLRKLAAEAKAATHKLASDTRAAGHDVARRDRPSDRS
ncbi:MAG TPA: hypothetical protein VMT68_04170 [Caulobacteraceae bacterium]|nr:hypothetical protein [Caulobacteraceae bacterium]